MSVCEKRSGKAIGRSGEFSVRSEGGNDWTIGARHVKFVMEVDHRHPHIVGKILTVNEHSQIIRRCESASL